MVYAGICRYHTCGYSHTTATRIGICQMRCTAYKAAPVDGLTESETCTASLITRILCILLVYTQTELVSFSVHLYVASSEMVCQLIHYPGYHFKWTPAVLVNHCQSLQYGQTTEPPSFVHKIRDSFYRPAPFHVVLEIQVMRYRRSRCLWRPVHEMLNVKDLST